MSLASAPTRGRRGDILAAASALFASKGYAATSLTDVRLAAGASVGSLYHHFPSREHLASALWQESVSSFQAGILTVLDGPAPAKRGIVGCVRFHADWIEDDPDRARFLSVQREPAVVELCRSGFGAENDRFHETVKAWYDRHVAAGTVLRVPFPALVAVWIGPMQELSRIWLESGISPPTKAAGVLGEAAWRALRANEGTRRR